MDTGIFQPIDFWRLIILYGRNTATYKLALARCLRDFAQNGVTRVSMQDLAARFFDLYVERLRNGMPQLYMPGRQTVMERIVALYNLGKLDRGTAIDLVEREAFDDVVPRFHTVNDTPVPTPFYVHTDHELVLTDQLMAVVSTGDDLLLDEIDSRWSLLEGAFLKRRENAELANDIRRFYLQRGYARTNISQLVPVLRGYQDDVCFYCGEQLGSSDVDVDHVIPRQVVYHDEVWNLVLAHAFCNSQKLDALPSEHYIEKLIQRNERLILSNHPIRETLISKLGSTPLQRRRSVLKVYDDARIVVPYTWEGMRGYNPATDPFYKLYIRSITR